MIKKVLITGITGPRYALLPKYTSLLGRRGRQDGITENMKNDFILTKNNKNTFGVFRCLRW
ncbi:MAG: hypothetical protein ABH836_04250 [Candidatus Omnitrophota bacterium]